MRSVFTITLPLVDDHYPPDEEIINWMVRLGWEPQDVRDGLVDDAVDTLKARYQELSRALLQQMPELPANEKKHVVFYGYLAGAEEQVQFIITRVTPEQITFRLLHEQLSRLQAGTERMVRSIIFSRLREDGSIHSSRRLAWWNLSRGQRLGLGPRHITVYERGYDHELISGRVVPRASLESISANKLDAVLFIVPLLLVFPAAAGIIALSPSPDHPSDVEVLLLGTLERGSTALITTAIVSLLGLLATYMSMWRRFVVWSVSSAPTLD